MHTPPSVDDAPFDEWPPQRVAMSRELSWLNRTKAETSFADVGNTTTPC